MGVLCSHRIWPVFAPAGNDPAQRTFSAALSEMASLSGADAGRVRLASGHSQRPVDGIPCRCRPPRRTGIRRAGSRHGNEYGLGLEVGGAAAIRRASPLDVALLSLVVLDRRAAIDHRTGHGDGRSRRLVELDYDVLDVLDRLDPTNAAHQVLGAGLVDHAAADRGVRARHGGIEVAERDAFADKRPCDLFALGALRSSAKLSTLRATRS